ncbi:MAG: ATP-dependent sacrificial sulfur transferase LarE [Oscillospiraceae bacterium]|nr:ATP-dependent sacrificial sulfur transferase LarE [Oscillospiraceae bacterium]
MTLSDFFHEHPSFALAFSGGTDSSYLLYAAVKAGCAVSPYFLRSQLQPAFELDDAERLCAVAGVRLNVLEADALSDPGVAANGPERCYHCKKRLFGLLCERAARDGFSVVCDGTNASDDVSDRPGYRALAEYGVLSPLRLCGITKTEVRRLSREAGLFTAQKPSYACLATRVRTGERLTAETLGKIEAAETALFSLGYTDLRVRVSGNEALLQLPAPQLARALSQWDEAEALLLRYFAAARLDRTPRRSD